MNIKICFLFFLFAFISCQDQKTEQEHNQQDKTTKSAGSLSDFEKIIEAHGGKLEWKALNTFKFSTTFPFENSIYKVDLPTKRMHIQNNNFNAAFDGKNLWLQDRDNLIDQQVFKRQFDLAFYIAAGPFAFLHEGTLFTQRLDEEIMRKSYGVIHIGFGRGSGKSSDDEFIIYYNKETYRIAWLGYTVVNYERYKSKRWEFIKYSSFEEISGFDFPNKFEVFGSEEDKPTKLKGTSTVEAIEISNSTLPEALFEAPSESEFIN